MREMTAVEDWPIQEEYIELDSPSAWIISWVRTSRMPPTGVLWRFIEEGLNDDAREAAADEMEEIAPGQRLTTAMIGRPNEGVSSE